MQTELISRHESLARHVEAASKAHVTLAVLHLSEEAVEDCKAALSSFKPSYPEEDRTVNFTGIGLFSKRVVFAKPSSNIEFLKNLRAEVLSTLISGNIAVLEADREFNPHVTLFKIGRERKRRKSGEDKSKNKLDIEEERDNYSEYNFGDQVFNEMELLSMNKAKAADGYYFSEGQFSLVDQ